MRILDLLQNEAFDTEAEWILGFDHGNKKVFATKVEDAYIELTYNLLSNGDLYISFSRSGKMAVTGEGKQNKIFGAVINHIKSYAAQTNPKRLVFSAFKPATGPFGSQDTTRSSLYRRMVQRFASQNGYEYDVEDTGNEDTFILTKKESALKTNESLNQPYPVRWNKQTNEEWFAWAKDDEIQIQIKTIDSGRWNIRFKVNETMDKTGAGDQFRIFATVKAAIQEWWKWASKNTSVETIKFSAEKITDDSRSKLYSRFAKQFADAIGYTIEVAKGRASDFFYINRPNTNETRTTLEQAILDGGHTLEETIVKPKVKHKINIYNTLMNEKYKHGDYARGGKPMPKAKKGRTQHPLHGKLVG
jgi:hypothetical protein